MPLVPLSGRIHGRSRRNAMDKKGRLTAVAALVGAVLCAAALLLGAGGAPARPGDTRQPEAGSMNAEVWRGVMQEAWLEADARLRASQP
jgi:hypothetical protein